MSKTKSCNEMQRNPPPKRFFSSSRRVAEANPEVKSKGISRKKIWNSSNAKQKGESPATIEKLLKQLSEQNRMAEERTRKAEARAEKAEARAEKAEERALKAEQRAKRVEAKLENILDNVSSINSRSIFC